MKRLGFALILALAVVSMLLAGCGGDGDDNGDTATPKPTATLAPGETGTPPPTATAEATPKPTAKPSGDVGDIISDMTSISSVKYDMEISGVGIPASTTTMWLKPATGMKMETTAMGMTTITIINYDDEVMYNYMPDQNMALELPWGDIPDSPLEGAEDLDLYGAVITGSDTIDGKKCVVVEYSEGVTTTKLWVWENKGFPLRVEVDSAQGQTVMKMTNIDFSNISDGEFELPSGVQITKMP